MISKLNSLQINYLKGVAILAVMAAHFINRYIRDFTTIPIPRFANQMVILFFIIAGHLTYISLKKKLTHASFKETLTVYRKFYRKKFFRLYPLYWVALAFAVFFIGTELGIPEILMLRTTKYFWFMTALLQCYLLSPLIFYMRERLSLVTFFVISTVALLSIETLFNPASAFTSFQITPFISFPDYRSYTAGYLLPFSLGMAVPSLLVYKEKFKKVSIWLIYITYILLIFLPNFTQGDSIAEKILATLFLTVSPILYAIYISIEQKSFPFQKHICHLGTYSYSFFLFHAPYNHILYAAGLLGSNVILSVGALVVTFPLFVYIVQNVEYGYNKLVASLI